MISEITAIVNYIRDITKYKQNKDREKRIIELFEAYYYFYDICYDSKKMLNNMDENPLEYIKNLDKELITKQLEIWDSFLRKQSLRLYNLQNYIYENSFLALINPKSVDSIKKIVGYKLDTVKTLHQLGAGLFFRNIFPQEERPEDIAELVIEVLTFDEKFSIDKIKIEIGLLENELENFSSILKESVEKKDFFALSEKARKNTLLEE